MQSVQYVIYFAGHLEYCSFHLVKDVQCKTTARILLIVFDTTKSARRSDYYPG